MFALTIQGRKKKGQKMKKLFLSAILIIATLTLFGCSDSDIPDGMQLVSGGEDKGYYFYAPEEWTVSNIGKTASAYASSIDNTSVSFAEVDKSNFPLAEGQTAKDYFFNSYFEDSLKEFPESLQPKITVKGENCLFGTADAGADQAKKYVYEYTYGEHPFGFIQILSSYGDNYYIFTYAAQKAKRVESDETTRYDYHIENGKLNSVTDNFKFCKKSSAVIEDAPDIEKDEDGYILATDKTNAGFQLYLPESFKVDYSSAAVSATHSDGSNVNMTIASRAGIPAKDYWSLRKEELSLIATNIEVIQEDVSAKLGNNSQWAFLYEYTYEYNGAKYHVYQILAVDGWLFFGDGYVFTYTAKEENYQKHFSEIEKIISKVKF